MLEMDIHSFCNRDWEWCPRYFDRSGVRKDNTGEKIRKSMPTEKVYNIIDQANALGYKGIVKLHRLSEGLLDYRYIKFAEYIKEKGMKLSEDTNGDILRNNPELCSKLDGLASELRIGLYDYRDEYSKQKEMEYWQKKFLKSLVRFSLPLEECFIRKNTKYCYDAKYEKILDEPCFQPYIYFLIRYDGMVSLCCEDDQCNFELGNVFKQSLEEIWWSRKHIHIAKTLFKPGGRYCFKLCSKCAMVLPTPKSKKFYIRILPKQDQSENKDTKIMFQKEDLTKIL